MNRSTEITSLLAQLASHIAQKGAPLSSDEEASLLPSISSLNRSLNSNEESRVRVLDTALSLMCFKAPQVFESEMECMVETIVTVLSSSIFCRVLSFQRKEFLEIGSSISRFDCEELIEACLNVFGELHGHGMLSNMPLRAVLRVAASTSCNQISLPLPPILNVQPSYQKSTAVKKLHHILPDEIFVSNSEIPLRLLLWYLDPLILREDISRILKESEKRPFLCLKKELHEKMVWRSIISCLVLSPTMFIEARALLHSWFLVTGLAFILELRTVLASSLLDVVTRPMRWGISKEAGLKLPFSYAYFPSRQNLLVTLAGPVSCESLLSLSHLVSSADRHTEPIPRRTLNKAKMIDHNSTWAMLMEFPVWFYFATLLLFCGKNLETFVGKCTSGEAETLTNAEQYCAAAATYLAWILSPTNVYHSDSLAHLFIAMSKSWSLKQSGSETRNRTTGCKKKLRKLSFHDKSSMAAKEHSGYGIETWLKEFHDRHTRCNKTAKTNDFTGLEAPTVLTPSQSLLIRRIPLGIFIGCPNIDEEAFESLLHYAVTGAILSPTELQHTEGLHIEQKSRGYADDDADNDLIEFYLQSDAKREAIAGAKLVFSLFDIIEDMSDSLFETEEIGLKYICQLKRKAGRFLVNCVKKLLHLKIDEDGEGMVILMDLQKRLDRWQHKGREIQDFNALDDIVDTLNCKLSSFTRL